MEQVMGYRACDCIARAVLNLAMIKGSGTQGWFLCVAPTFTVVEKGKSLRTGDWWWALSGKILLGS